MSRICYLFVSRLAGGLLVLAGLLGVYSQFDNAALTTTPQTLLAIRAVGELSLGIWLILDFMPRLSWMLAIGAYTAFFVVSLTKALNGDNTCGCFGDLRVDPLLTSSVDGIIVFGLMAFRPMRFHQTPKPVAKYGLVVVFLTSFAVVSFAMIIPAAGINSQSNEHESTEVNLNPTEWAGRPMPFLPLIDQHTKLKTGRWIVMLYRWDCTSCQKFLPQYIALAYALMRESSNLRVAFIELPPYRVNSQESESAPYLRARLKELPTWPIRAPRFIRISNGIVEVTTDRPEVLLEAPTAPHDKDGGVITPTDRNAAGLFPDFVKLRREKYLSEIACGPLSLLAVFKELGLSLSPSEVDALIDEAGSLGIDMFRLKQLAEDRGLHALGASIGLNRLREIGHTAIVLLNGTGFAAVTGFASDAVRVVNPLQSEGLVPNDLFRRSFGDPGIVLIISRSPIRGTQFELPPNPERENRLASQIRVSRSILAVGRQHRHKWEAEVEVTNTSEKNLRLSVFPDKCPTCATVALSNSDLGPGGSTQLVVRGEEPQIGAFTYSVRVVIDQQPHHSGLKIPIRGYLEQPLCFRTPASTNRGLLPGEPVEVEIELDVSQAVKIENLKATVPLGAPLLASIRRRPDGQPSMYLHWQGADRPDWYRYRIYVSEIGLDDGIKVPFHFAAEVIPDLKLSPPSVYVDNDESSKDWKRTIAVELHRPVQSTINAEWSDSKLATAISAAVRKNENCRWTIELVPSSTFSKLQLPAHGLLNVICGNRTYPIPVYLGSDAWIASSRKVVPVSD